MGKNPKSSPGPERKNLYGSGKIDHRKAPQGLLDDPWGFLQWKLRGKKKPPKRNLGRLGCRTSSAP
jgi:hypothetical protein